MSNRPWECGFILSVVLYRFCPSLILYYENTKKYCSYRQRKLSIFINKYIFKFHFL